MLDSNIVLSKGIVLFILQLSINGNLFFGFSTGFGTVENKSN